MDYGITVMAKKVSRAGETLQPIKHLRNKIIFVINIADTEVTLAKTVPMHECIHTKPNQPSIRKKLKNKDK